MYNIVSGWLRYFLESINTRKFRERENWKRKVNILTRCVSNDPNVECNALNEVFAMFCDSPDVVLAIQKLRVFLNLRDKTRPMHPERRFIWGYGTQDAIDNAKKALIKTMCEDTNIPYNVLLGSTGFTEKQLERYRFQCRGI